MYIKDDLKRTEKETLSYITDTKQTHKRKRLESQNTIYLNIISIDLDATK